MLNLTRFVADDSFVMLNRLIPRKGSKPVQRCSGRFYRYSPACGEGRRSRRRALAGFATSLWEITMSRELIARAETILGYSFRDSALLVTSFTHSSSAGTRLESNERLEFLGDAVLGSVVCETLYRSYAEWLEGDLTKVKSNIVSRRICALIADEIGLTSLLILGNGIDTAHRLPTSLRAAVYEAVIGAIYLDGGYEPAKDFILRSAASQIEMCARPDNRENFKSALQQHVQRWLSATPRYDTLDEQGPDHSKCFEVCVVINHERFPSAWGPSKKEAEQEAARRALDILLSEGRLPQHSEGTET
jgi:ribonuclease-3